jgi:xanthosine utilization system XapX-like protein
MENRYTAESLKVAIKALEIKQTEDRQQLREQLLITYENLKPINILKNIVKDIYSSENYTRDLLEIVAGMASGFVSKKLVVRNSKDPILKLVGLAIQFGMTTLVSKKYNVIKDSVMNFINQFLNKKEEKKREEE